MFPRASSSPALNFWIDVFAVTGDLQQPRHVVNARDLPLDIVRGHVKSFEEIRRAPLDTVAEANGFHTCKALHVSGKDGHGIHVVEEPGVRADFFHIPGKILKDRECPQGTENPTNTQGISDSLTQTVLLWNFKVNYCTRLVSADLHCTDDIIGTAQGSLPIRIGHNLAMTAGILVEIVQHHL